MNLEKSALLVIDMQYDFMKKGSLEVPEANTLIEPINKLMQLDWGLIIASKDWHPNDHISFASNHKNHNPFETIELSEGYMQTLWPVHCVQDTKGAELHHDLNQSKISQIVLKGQNSGVDSYSAFFDNNHQVKTNLDNLLKKNGITDIYLVGLAADYCVKFSAIDGATLGYKTHFILEGTKFINSSIKNELRKELALHNISFPKLEDLL